MTLLDFKLMIPEGTPRCRDDRAKEKIFLEWYSWLVECALNITHGQRERAEDLVHDVFVRFLEQDADITTISNVRGYLNGMLRNLHLLQLRRTTRHPLQSLTLIDHDSALVGLRSWNAVEQLQSAELLVHACDFTCYRKEEAPTSSVLILRFFHGFYPEEICVLLKATRHAVDKWIVRGRNETKRYMESPYPLPAAPKTECDKVIPGSTSAFLRRLRQRIFSSCATDCAVLTKNREPFGVRELAHLVSCQACLNRRSRAVGLAHVAERMADDIADRDDGRPQNGTGGSRRIVSLNSRRKPSKRAIVRDVYARRKQLFEHRPKEISLVFDGIPRATLIVNAATNTLNVSIDSKELPSSVAVLSEQEFNFLLLDYDDLMGCERRVHRVSLSEDRSLEVTLTRETLGLSIRIVYLDQSFAAETPITEADEPHFISIENRIVGVPFRLRGAAADFGSEWRIVLAARFRDLIASMKPLLVSVVLGTAALCFLSLLRTVPTPSVGEILEHAQNTDRAATAGANRPGVIYEKVAIRTRHRTLERTIYRDAQGIRHPHKQQLSPEDEQLKNKLAIAGVNWDAPLSAIDFAAWRRRFSPTRDSVARSGHLLTLTTAPVANNEVVKETLMVRDTDFQGLSRSVELRDGGTVEIAQLNYDVLPWAAVNQDWFEPLPAGAATDVPGVLSVPQFRLPSELELETELAVRHTLHAINADLGEPIEIRPGNSAGTLVSVVGVVSSAERKQELLTALGEIPGVAARLQTEEEAASEQRRGRFRRAEPLVATAHFAIEKALLGYFGDPLAVDDFSKRTVAAVQRLMAHAWALRHLSERYGALGSRSEVALSPASRELLRTMRRDHYRAMSEATSELTTLLRPVLQSIVDGPSEPTTKLPAFESAERVQRLTLELFSGSEWSSESGTDDVAKGAQDLLTAIRGLEITLEEQP